MISRQLSAFVLSALFAAPLLAVTVDGLYGATVPVADRTAAESDRGVAQAFAEVIVKLTGKQASLEGKPARGLLAKARNFVTVVGQAQSGNATDGYRLRVDFDPAALSAALRERGLTLWSSERPLTSAHLLVGTTDGQAAGIEDMARVISAAAERRGLPLKLLPATPVPTTGEASAIFDTLLGPDPTPAATSPLPESLVAAPELVGLFRQAGEAGWSADWRLRVNGLSMTWRETGPDAQVLANTGIDRVAEQVAASYVAAAGTSGELETVSLSVEGLHSAADYGRTLKLLRSIDIVERLDVKSVIGDSVNFDLAARGGLAALNQNLRLSGQLQATANDPGRWTLVNP